MFIRKRISPSRRQTPSYQVIESYRDPESDTPRQRVIINLGPHATPEDALKAARAKARGLVSAGATEQEITAAQDCIKTLERIARKLRA
jgi:hypothetical protein